MLKRNLSTWSVLSVKFVTALCLVYANLSVCLAANCYKALAECHLDTKCARKLLRYANECASIVNTYNTNLNISLINPCSNSCVRSIKALRKTSKGRALWKCNCYLDGRCISLKTRTEKCLSIANGTYRKRTGCTLARSNCMRDTSCREAQNDFLKECAKLFTLEDCTDRCLCSQKRLFNLSNGRPLFNCECDGSEEMYCLGLQAHADYMKCSWKEHRRARRKLKKKRCKRCRDRRRGMKCGRRGKGRRKT